MDLESKAALGIISRHINKSRCLPDKKLYWLHFCWNQKHKNNKKKTIQILIKISVDLKHKLLKVFFLPAFSSTSS